MAVYGTDKPCEPEPSRLGHSQAQRNRIRGRTLRIAILGTRGVPGNYGGFETFAEELSARLVQRGHEATVYCRSGRYPSRPTRHRGISLVYLPAVPLKSLETLSHTLISVLHAAMRRFDVVYVCNSANAPFCYIPWLRRQRVILNVDGLEWRRAKWGRLARRYYRWAAALAARMPIDLVTDAEVIRAYYRTEFNRETRCVPYGSRLTPRGTGAERLIGLSLAPNDYILYVSRLEPENNALLVVEAYRQVDTGIPLVIVGDAPYAREYIDRVHAAADGRVRFLGYRFGEEYEALQANALVYVQATEVGGTHPALVEAMGHGNAILAQEVPEHLEVLGPAGRYFRLHDVADLALQLQTLIRDEVGISELRAAASERAAAQYSWDAVTDAYEQYFAEITS